jgi:hypothetical protein
MHIEFLLEEESCAAALDKLLPQLLGADISFHHHVFQGKPDLLAKLPERLRAYGKWITDEYRIVVLLDRDDDDCQVLKARLDEMSARAHLRCRRDADENGRFQVLNRIAVEELEAWFFGDVSAITQAFPRVPPTLGSRRGYRDPDAISGGTWEKLERVLKDAGYYAGGMPKIEVARQIAGNMDPSRNRSQSFCAFLQGLRLLVP